MKGYTYNQLKLWKKTDRNVCFTLTEISDSLVSLIAPVTNPVQSSSFQIKKFRLVLCNGIEIHHKIINQDSAISLICKLSV